MATAQSFVASAIPGQASCNSVTEWDPGLVSGSGISKGDPCCAENALAVPSRKSSVNLRFTLQDKVVGFYAFGKFAKPKPKRVIFTDVIDIGFCGKSFGEVGCPVGGID